MLKSNYILLIKLGFLFLIFYWLLSSGSLSLSDLSIYVSDRRLVVQLLLTWAFSFVLLGALRWKLICSSLKIPKNYLSTVNLQLIGAFFNIFMPGAVGGDLVKAFYLAKDSKEATKTVALLSVFLDRLSGIMGLFICGFCVTLMFVGDTMLTYSLLPFAALVCLLFIGSTVLFCLFLFRGEQLISWMQRKASFLVGASSLNQLKLASNALKENPKGFIGSLGLSILIQGANMAFFYYICTKFSPDVSAAHAAVVFPLGMVISSIPFAPGGMGVGHVAFEKLFVLVGLSPGIGANAFNLYFVGLLACFCLGGVPYLLKRGKIHRKEMQAHC